MENTLILLNQIIVMFIFIAVGFILRRFKLVTQEGTGALSNFLLYVILPCVIIRSFAIERTPENTRLLFVSMGVSIIAIIISIGGSALIFHKYPTENFASSFSNSGYMAVPLIAALLGDGAVVYVSGMVALLNALQWTYGQAILTHDWKLLSPKEVIKSPIVIAFLLGIVVYLVPFSLPSQIYTAISTMADCNAPVAMIILGAFLTEASLKDIVRKNVWAVSAVRLLILPVITILVLAPLTGISLELRTAVVLAEAAPVGSNIVVYERKLNKDAKDGAAMVCTSTLLSSITMPLMYILFQAII